MTETTTAGSSTPDTSVTPGRGDGGGAEELVVLCSPDGQAVGTASKSQVHHRDTPLHLAFSCYVFDTAGRTLLTRRARAKRVFPGVRTNSCCGHPAPGESMLEAVRRRLRQELGIVPISVDLVLPAFRYRAEAPDGVVEHELCPVFRAVTSGTDVAPDPAEVDDAWWVPWDGVPLLGVAPGEASNGTADADPLSPWAARQVPQLALLGPDPLAWPVGEPALLPPAAHL